MKRDGRIEWTYPLIILSTRYGEYSATRPGLISPLKELKNSHWLRGRTSSWSGLLAMNKLNTACVGNRTTTHWSSIPSLITTMTGVFQLLSCHHTDLKCSTVGVFSLVFPIVVLCLPFSFHKYFSTSRILIKSLVVTARSQAQSLRMKLLQSNFRSGHISRSFLSPPSLFFVLLQMDDSVTSRLNCTIDYVVICCTSCRLRLSLSG